MAQIRDPAQRRVLGVLLEKELAVPESYPMTEAAVLAGCNQKSNRDPEMALEAMDVRHALDVLRAEGWLTRVDGARASRYRHEVDNVLGLERADKAILAELILRGPQAPGALKPRIARMGANASAEEIGDRLAALRDRAEPLVVKLPRQPRERDWRWTHTLAERDEVATAAPADAAAHPRTIDRVPEPEAPERGTSLLDRVAALEAKVAELEARLENR